MIPTSFTVPGGRYTSDPSTVAPVTVYAPPAAPSIASIGAATVTVGAQVGGRGVAGGIVKLFDGSTLVGTTTIAADGTWSVTLNVLSLGRHTIAAQQQDPVSTFWSALSAFP